jgi:hypothetical protein
MLRIAACALTVLEAVLVVSAAPPPAPPPPAAYDVVVRYSIVAFQNERVIQFRAMMKELAGHGFRRDPNEEPAVDEAADQRATRLRGTVPAANVWSLLRERHVRSLLLIPEGQKLPEDGNQPVRVNLELSSNLPPDRQQLLHAQTIEALGPLKFTESVGYDHRGFTRIVGTMPSGQVNVLLADLRELPSGHDLPPPFASVTAIRIAEVRPDLPSPAARPAVPPVPPGQAKLSAGLRDLSAQPEQAGRPTRLEVLLAYEPESRDRNWQTTLQGAAPGAAIEGILGSVVTLVARPDQTAALAVVPQVVGVRLPRIARSIALDAQADDLTNRIAAGLERLHTRGYRGKGSRIAVVGDDFRGWEKQVRSGLPKGTQIIDLTRERNDNLEPDPFADRAGPGEGTRFARLAASAAPEADVVLIRVDPRTPYMVHSIASAAVGGPIGSLALAQREQQLDADRARLDFRRQELLEERRQVFEDLSDEGEPLRRREEYRKKQAAFDREQHEYQARLRRFIDHQRALLNLKGVRVVASPLEWSSNAFAGSSDPLRLVDGGRSALWIQPLGLWNDSTWSGLFRDADGNGVMEFAETSAPLATDSWTRELNFFGWKGADGKLSPELPAGSRVRVTFQWREPHDPALAHAGLDAYREPVMPVRLLLLRQLDPSGAKRPADDMEIVAQSVGIPQRLDQSPSSATYEASVVFRVPEAGRYALRIEGRAPDGDRPPSMAVLPSQRRRGEIHPRIVATTLDGAGHAVWRDYKGDPDDVGTGPAQH